MKKYQILFLLMILLMSGERCWAAPEAFTQNEFTTAESLETGMSQTGIHFTIGHGYQSYYPTIRYGLYSLLEIGAKFGVATTDTGTEDKIGALVGIDLKYQLIKETEGVPVDMAIDVGFDSVFISGGSAHELTFSTIVSKSLPLTEKGYKITPYGGVELASENGSYHDKHDTNVFVFGGVEWRLTQKFMLLAEIKTGEFTLGGAAMKFEY